MSLESESLYRPDRWCSGANIMDMVKNCNEEFELILNLDEYSRYIQVPGINWEATVTSLNYTNISKQGPLCLEGDETSLNATDYTLDTLRTVALCATLEDVIDKLIIIGGFLNLPEPEKSITHKSMEECYKNVETDEQNVASMNQTEESMITMQKESFQKHRAFYEILLREIYGQLSSNNIFFPLVYHTSQIERIRYEQEHLIKIEVKNQKYLRNLLFTLHYEKTSGDYNLLAAVEEFNNLTDSFADEELFLKINVRYVEDWERARAEQNELRIIHQEKKLREELSATKRKLEREERVHNEIDRAIRVLTEDMTEDLQKWEEKYGLDMENKEVEISMLKELRDEQFEKLQALQELYTKHRLEIEEYYELKRLRALEVALRARRHMAAWKIQRWWRRWYAWKHRKKHRMNLKDVKKLRKKLKEKLHQ